MYSRGSGEGSPGRAVSRGRAGTGTGVAGGTGARRRLPRCPRSRRCVRRPRGGAAGPGMRTRSIRIRRRPGAASARRPFAVGGCLSARWSSPTPPVCRHPLPSLFLSPGHTGPSPRAQDGGMGVVSPSCQQANPWDLLQGPFLWSSLCRSKVQPHFSR